MSLAGQTGAQEAPTPPAAETLLETMVVTASRREQAIGTAPASITVIDRREIEARPETSVTELLRQVEGVSVVGANPNDQDIAVRGMPGDYTLLLVDGKRQNTRETMNRGNGGVQANLLPPLAAIERIEVVRGPMSSLYGSDAMGGVINIITRKLPTRWSGAATAHSVHQKHQELGDSWGAEFWLGGPLADETLGLQLSGSTKIREEDDVYYPLNATSGANGQHDGRLDLKLTARLAAGQDLSLNLGREDFNYLMTPGLSIADTATAATVLKTRHRRDHWGLSHEGRWEWGRSSLALYGETGLQTQEVASGASIVEPELRNTTLDGRVELPWSDSGNTLTVGTQVHHQRLSGVSKQDAVPAGLPANPDSIERNAWAVFGESDFALGALTLTAGARLDHDDKYGHHLSPRLYGVYTIDRAWTLRGGAGTGFKAPTLRQSTAGYCMTTGGAAGATPGTLCGNTELEPETSTTVEMGIRWDSGGNSASAVVFANRVKNRVTSFDTGVPDPRVTGRNIYVYDNIARVDINGVELATDVALSRQLRLAANYTYTDSKRGAGGENAFDGSSLEGRPLDKTPKHMANLRLQWRPRQALELYTALHYTGRQHWAAFRNGALGMREREATTTLDLGGRYTLMPGVDLKVSMLNLTDKRVDVDARPRTGGLSGNWMADEGRRISVAVAAQF
ncbi:TonB-dependent receptor [Aquabacterium sp. A7-Y]|uniref:TonB-dependent receptor domain-containing protein n=1 Tax=Aquabacterium sp. A7-Y TaxID=1349605 RepID=UPI00223DD8F3|nr:TonB-dependent receptor [Aquabacterium sp. A7-Y]MCW7536824.1 TonB-dependent receptor [Aquabacterium sp. A7-Y]